MTRAETPCPSCGEAILSTAKKCKHCGDWLDPKLKAAHRVSPGGAGPPTVMAVWGVAHMVLSGVFGAGAALGAFNARGGFQTFVFLLLFAAFVLSFLVGRGMFRGHRWALSGATISAVLVSALCLFALTQEPEIGVFFFVWTGIIYIPPLVSGFLSSRLLT